MTTTIYDVDLKVVASDSRWSIDLAGFGFPDLVAYVDDTGFDKIADRPTHVLSLAGDAELIGMWKSWWAESELPAEHPPVELDSCRQVVLSIINKQTDTIDFDCGPKLTQACSETMRFMAVFAGSGSNWAAEHWGLTRCPKQSVAYAAANDAFTGGEYKHISYGLGQTNLGPCVSAIEVIHEGILNRGFVMHKTERNPVPIKDNLDLSALQAAIEDRRVVAQAPVAAQNDFRWTPERKERLSNVLTSIREAEKAL